jgi:hypothetical protein
LQGRDAASSGGSSCDCGYTEGRNFVIEYRWAEGRYEHHAIERFAMLKASTGAGRGTPG